VLMQFNSKEEKVTCQLEKDDSFIFPICAKSPAALKELATEYRDYIENNRDNLAQILSNAIYRRSHHSERLAIVASSPEELIEKLEAFEEDILLKGVVQGTITTQNPKIVFVYTGMGPQWWKMGKELMEREPVF